MQTAAFDLNAIGVRAREAARVLAKVPTRVKDRALIDIADGLRSRRDEILAANEQDRRSGQRDGLSDASLDRLLLDADRLEALANDVRNVAALPDPIGQTSELRVLPNGLRLGKRRVSLGVIGTIYESRPNVTIDIAVLCFKAGNAVILRGGKEAFNSNLALASLVRDCIDSAGAPRDAVQFVESTDRALVGEMLAMKDHIDLMIPRGGEELVRRVAAEAAMPAITGGIGVCHTYVEGSAKIEMAVEIAYNAKVSRPSVCNALDTLLVDASVAPAFLPRIAYEWSKAGVEMHCDRRALSILGRTEGLRVAPATDEDWGKEFLSLTAAVKVVDSLDEALAHIEAYTSGHTEVIVTENYTASMRFLDEVDAGVVMVNASSRFNDGAQFGLGAEVGISTNKLHARGPMGLIELTSYKWTVLGSGQIRE